MRLRIEVAISDYQSGGNLRFSDEVSIEEADFGKLAAILARFHDLMTEVKGAKHAADV